VNAIFLLSGHDYGILDITMRISRRYILLFVFSLFITKFINAGEIYYVTEYCMLREWPGIDDNEIRKLMIGEEVEDLGKESREYNCSKGIDAIKSTFKKVKTNDNKEGWIASAFIIKKKLITNLAIYKKERTVDKIIDIVKQINDRNLSSKDIYELESLIESIVSKRYETADEIVSHIYGSGFHNKYCFANAEIIIYPTPAEELKSENDGESMNHNTDCCEGEYEDQENNVIEDYLFVGIILTVPIELKNDVINRIIEVLGEIQDDDYIYWYNDGIATYIIEGEREIPMDKFVILDKFFVIYCGFEGL
jgi:hypothetical protein